MNTLFSPTDIGPDTERVLFNWVLEKPEYVEEIHPEYFNNTEIKFIFKSIKKYLAEYPTTKRISYEQIRSAVRLDDPEREKVSDKVLQKIVTIDWSNFEITRTDGRKPWLIKTFEGWLIRNRMNKLFSEMALELREVSASNYEQVVNYADKVTSSVKHITEMKEEEEDTILDFFNPVDHIQPDASEKVTTGYPVLDEMLGGGFDYKTLNVLMGSSGTGKTVWMCNLAANACKAGKNVLYITLELSHKKVMKRLGSMAFKIPIKEYDSFSRDQEALKERMDRVVSTWGAGLDSEPGRLYVQEFPTSSMTVHNLESFIEKTELKLNIDFDMVIVDYMNLMVDHGKGDTVLYSKGKTLAEGLRRIAQSFKLVMVTPSQVSKDAMEATQVTLQDIPESKAIGETADVVLASIRTLRQRQAGLKRYEIQPVKLRDASFGDERFIFDFKDDYLSIENGRLKPNTD